MNGGFGPSGAGSPQAAHPGRGGSRRTERAGGAGAGRGGASAHFAFPVGPAHRPGDRRRAQARARAHRSRIGISRLHERPARRVPGAVHPHFACRGRDMGRPAATCGRQSGAAGPAQGAAAALARVGSVRGPDNRPAAQRRRDRGAVAGGGGLRARENGGSASRDRRVRADRGGIARPAHAAGADLGLAHHRGERGHAAPPGNPAGAHRPPAAPVGGARLFGRAHHRRTGDGAARGVPHRRRARAAHSPHRAAARPAADPPPRRRRPPTRRSRPGRSARDRAPPDVPAR